MSAERTWDELLSAAGDAVRWAFLSGVELLHATRASLLVIDRNEGALRMAAAVGFEAAVIPAVSVPLGQGIAGLAAERNMTLFGEVNGSRYMSVPVTHAQTVLGVLNVTNREEGDDFADEDLTFVRALADHIGHLLARARAGEIDSRSGLADRAMLTDVLEREIERGRRANAPFTLALVGFLNRSRREDDSEQWNRVGQELRAATRGYDLVARFDDDRFVVLFPSTTAVSDETLERFRAILARGFQVDVADVGSAVVHYPVDGTTARELMGQLERRFGRNERQRPLSRRTPR